jgi:hypothetical protein
MNKVCKRDFISSVFFLFLLFPLDAMAYINPSILGLVGILLAGFLTVIGFYFFKIIDFFQSVISKIKSVITRSK